MSLIARAFFCLLYFFPPSSTLIATEIATCKVTSEFLGESMTAIVEIMRPSSDDDVWRVAVDGRSVVAFYGEGARQLAESHRDALVELLSADAGLNPPPVIPASAAAVVADPLDWPVGTHVSSIFPVTIN
jgi:hypothetical protein